MHLTILLISYERETCRCIEIFFFFFLNTTAEDKFCGGGSRKHTLNKNSTPVVGEKEDVLTKPY